MTQRKPIVLVGIGTSDLASGDDVGDIAYWQAQALTAAQKAQAAANGGFVANGSGTGQNTGNQVKLGWNGSAILAQVDGTALGNMWTDALASMSKSSTGYVVFPNGFIFQWNAVSISGDSATNFPMAFPNNCAGVLPVVTGNPASGIAVAPAVDQVTKSGFAIRPRSSSASAVPQYTYYFCAWGW